MLRRPLDPVVLLEVLEHALTVPLAEATAILEDLRADLARIVRADYESGAP